MQMSALDLEIATISRVTFNGGIGESLIVVSVAVTFVRGYPLALDCELVYEGVLH